MLQPVSFRVVCGNVVLSQVLSIDYTFSQTEIGSATIKVVSLEHVVPEQEIIIEAGTDQRRRVFTGYVDACHYDAEQQVYVIQARDVLKKALDTFLIQEVKFGVDVEKQKYYYSTYTSMQGGIFTVHEYSSLSALHAAHPETIGNITEQGVKAHAVVQWLLVMCGIDEHTRIRVWESDFWVGDITPVTFHLTSVYDAIQQLVSLLGWMFFCDAYGVCRFQPKPRRANIVELSPDMLLHATKTVSNDQLRNYVEVVGYSGIRVVERAPSPYLGSTPYRGVLISNEFIDTPELASFVAKRTLHELNRLRWRFQLTTLPFPITHLTLLSIPSLFDGFIQIESVSASINSNDGFVYNIQAVDFIDELFLEEEQNDVSAEFAVNYLSTIGDPKHLVLLDGSPSFSLNGTIVQWTWNVYHTATPTVLTGQQVYTYLDATQSTTVRLTVQDSQGKTAFVERAIVPSGIVTSPVFRSLYACFTTFAAGSLDGGNTWITLNIPAQFVAVSHLDEIADTTVEPYVLFLTTTNRLYRAPATLETSSLLPPTNVSAVAISYSTPSVAYYSSGNTLYQSTDAAYTFSPLLSLPLAIRHIDVDRTAHQYLYVSCYPTSTHPNGALYIVDAASKTSTDLWASWNTLNDAPVFYVGGSASSTAVVQWIVSTSGVYAIVNGQPLAMPLANIASLTPSLHEWNKAYVVFSDGSYGTVLISGTVLTYQPIQTHVPFSFALRDGSAPHVLYYATASGIEKSLDEHNTILPLYTPSAASHVMYGTLQQPSLTFASGVVAYATYLVPLSLGSNDPYWHGSKRYLYVAALGNNTSATNPSQGWHRVILPDHVVDTTATDCDGNAVYGYVELSSVQDMTKRGLYYVHPYPKGSVVPFAFRIPKRLTEDTLGVGIPSYGLYTLSSGVAITLTSIAASYDGQQSRLSVWYTQQYASTGYSANYTTFHHAHLLFSSPTWTSDMTWQVETASPPLAESLLPAQGTSSRASYSIAHVASVYPFTKGTVASLENSSSQILVHVQYPHVITAVSYASKQYVPVTKPAPESYTVLRATADDSFWLSTEPFNTSTKLELPTTNPWTTGFAPNEWHWFLPFPEPGTYEIGVYITWLPPGSYLQIARDGYPPLSVPDVAWQWIYLTVSHATGFYYHRREFHYKYRKLAEPFHAVQASRQPYSSALYCATRRQLYRILDYGRGARELIYTVPSSYAPVSSSMGGIRSFTVTYNKQMNSDALCIVLQSPTNTKKGVLAYRYHDADAWKYHAWEVDSTLGVFYNAWVIVP